jgi:NADH-quinone oxidoreductase subunit A
MLVDLSNVLVFMIVGMGVVLLLITIARLLAPREHTTSKALPYECGEMPQGQSWIRFNNRFFIIALIFIVFDVELALVLPAVVVYREWVVELGKGLTAFTEIVIFVGILLLGLAYVWRKGDFEWIKTIQSVASVGSEPAPTGARGPAAQTGGPAALTGGHAAPAPRPGGSEGAAPAAAATGGDA